MAARLFFSYCHVDEALRDRLEVNLVMLKREGLLAPWHDREITAGDEMNPAIHEKLEQADVILFLVSPDFLASTYCYEIEVKRAMERHAEGSARVIPVILRPCEWKKAPFGKLLATPTDAEPITKWADRDDAFLDVTRAIRRAVEELGKTTEPTATAISSIHSPLATPAAATTLPRSSNMRVTKIFTQHDQAAFRDETFEFVSNFFEGSLGELERRNADVETRFRRIDADRFTAVIYRSGNQVSACTIFRGGMFGGDRDIYYSMHENAATNGYNASVSVDFDEQSLFMRASPMSFSRSGNEEAKLSSEGVAEFYWSILMEPLQRSR
ncbi:toll/interleukin-1 receptor domain-containing protein [Paracoccus pacificus]|uniref:Toll/interleukin-1 receptor domain-containing protein n=1 Tax=Paracoccus pacificus TaxID=1463598 RepID=A0ABW4R617_9RHOB